MPRQAAHGRGVRLEHVPVQGLLCADAAPLRVLTRRRYVRRFLVSLALTAGSSDWVYGRGTATAITLCISPYAQHACVAHAEAVVAAIVGLVARTDRQPGHTRVLDSTLFRRLSALSRATSYQGRIGRFTLVPLSLLLLALLTATYFLLLTFIPQPYVWPTPRHGSDPPIAVRSGWVAMAALPFVIMLGSKCVGRPGGNALTPRRASLVTLITGISHERLQVAHRLISYLLFASALVHGVAFAVVGNHAGRKADWTELECARSRLPHSLTAQTGPGSCS